MQFRYSLLAGLSFFSHSFPTSLFTAAAPAPCWTNWVAIVHAVVAQLVCPLWMMRHLSQQKQGAPLQAGQIDAAASRGVAAKRARWSPVVRAPPLLLPLPLELKPVQPPRLLLL